MALKEENKKLKEILEYSKGSLREIKHMLIHVQDDFDGQYYNSSKTKLQPQLSMKEVAELMQKSTPLFEDNIEKICWINNEKK